MISAILQTLLVVMVILLLLLSTVIIKAVSAKCVTGKWPHESELSQKIYRELP